jgi:hypothetical protein
MPNDGKTPLERQQEAEKANTRVTDTGEAAERDEVEGDGVPLATGASYDPPVGAHEVKDEGGPDAVDQVDLVMRHATLEKEKEAAEAAEEDQPVHPADRTQTTEESTKSETTTKSTPTKSTSKSNTSSK